MQRIQILFLPLFLLSFYGFTQGLDAGNCNDCGYSQYYYSEPSLANQEGESHGLLLFLHGNAGNTSFARVLTEGLPKAMEDPNKNTFEPYVDDYFVYVPFQDPSLGTTEYEPDRLNDFLDFVLQNNSSIDPNRIVLMGFSKGGKGAWNFAVKYPERLAGVLTVMGGLTSTVPESDYCNVENLPIWAISSEFDSFLPPYSESISSDPKVGSGLIINYLKANCAMKYPPEIRLLLTKNHHGWDELFDLSSGYNIYEWMKSLDKSKTDNYAPILSILPDQKIVGPEWTFHGYAFDIDSEILSIDWDISPVGGPLSIPDTEIEGTDYFRVSNLIPGNYVVTMTATDQVESVSTSMEIEVLPSYPSPINGIFMTYTDNALNTQTINISEIDFIDSDLIGNPSTVDVFIQDPLERFFQLGLNENYNFLQASAVGGTLKFSDYNAFGQDAFQLFSGDVNRWMTFSASTVDGTVYQADVFVGTENPLPITLLSFTGKVADQGVRLDWSTTEEEGNSHFEIYRGRSGDDLVKIGETAKAPPGNLYNYYSFTDSEAREGIYYYQLQSVDYDGHRDISEIIRVALTPGEEFKVYPNPATNGQFTITYSPDNGQRPVLFNSRGQQVEFTLATSPNGPGEQQVILKNALPGMYMLQVWHKGQPETRKVLVE